MKGNELTMKMTTRDMVLSAVFAAVIAVFAVITIPVGQIPITMGFFGIMLAAVVLGPKRATLSVLVYILIGAVGMPVFSGFKGGFTVLAGPTGGYINSYILLSLIVGAAANIAKRQKYAAAAVICFIGCLAGTAVCYFFGTLQFIALTGKGVKEALAMCVIGFIPFDIMKGIAASIVGLLVSKRPEKAV